MILEQIIRRPSETPRPTPLLFVHGAWHGAWCWDVFFLPYFAEKGYHCTALSLRGHAKSPTPKPFSLNGVWDYVSDVAEVASQIEEEFGKRPAIIAHSMGGYVTQKYLERHTTPAAVLVAPIPVMGIWPMDIRLLTSVPLDMLKGFVTFSAYPFVSTPQKAKRLFFSKSMSLDEVETYQAQMCGESLRILLDATLKNRPHPDKIHPTPMLVVAAEEDAVFPLREEEATARAYGATLKVYPDTAHDMMLEPNWQPVADDILAWLDAQGIEATQETTPL